MSKVRQAIDLWALQQGDKLAIKSNSQSYTYTELATEINHLADELVEYQGQTLAIEIGNSPAWVITDLACIQNSICTVPIPAFFTPSQREHAVSSSGAVALLNDQAKGDEIPTSMNPLIFIETISAQASKLPQNTAKVTYTSGSTGEPKGVCLSLSAMEQVAESLLEVLGNEIGENTAAILPLPVLLENIAGCYATLLAGGCYNIHTPEHIGFSQPFMPDFKKMMEYLKDSKASSCILVPELLRGLMQTLAVTQSTLPDMQYIAVGGSKVSDKLLIQAQSLGLPVYQGYGLSEAASVIAINKPDHNKPTSVGQLLPHINLTSNDEGELLINNPDFLGYVGDKEVKTVFATGDLGEIDQNGFVYLSGRKKNLLITSQGRNVSPEWPESELLTQPTIMQTVVVGDGQAYLSALIVPASAELNDEHISAAIQQVNQNLPEYAQIQKWLMVPPFTLVNGQLTGTGRIRRNIITQYYESAIEQLYTPASSNTETTSVQTNPTNQTLLTNTEINKEATS